MNKLNKALFEMQKELGLTLTKDAKNPFYKSSYLSLPNLSETVQPLFVKYGLLLQQPIVSIGELTYVKTRIIHVESGETQEELALVTVAKSTDPQALGSGITYMRRFALGAHLGLAAEDDDGNAASGKSLSPSPKSEVKPSSDTKSVASAVPTSGATSSAAKPRTTFKRPGAVTTVTTGTDDGWNN